MGVSPVIELLTVADVPHDVALSRSVHWPDTEADWRALHAGARVLGIRNSGKLVAHGALGDYGVAATLAKMVVAPDQQRRGLGAKLLDALLAHADERSIPVGLCATDQGRRLYETRGFVESGRIVIFTGAPVPEAELGLGDVAPLDVATALELDRRFSGCDRSRMLAARLADARAGFVLRAPGEVGFGMVTQQEPFCVVGPIWAETEQGARMLARALLGAARGPFLINVPAQHVGFRSWLSELGLQEQAERSEMARGAPQMPWQCRQRFALATQAWG
jgi:GNAT superfamily N-acetyltransferase